MKYCLAIGLHNLFFDIAIVNEKHEIVNKCKLTYDRNQDISRNIYLAYRKYFSEFKIAYIGVGISNNIQYKEEVIYQMTALNLNHYNLKQALYKLFKVEVYLMDETNLGALAISYRKELKSLLYVILDNRISNSVVFEHCLVELDKDIDLLQNANLNEQCSKDALKHEFLKLELDDDYLGTYFFSHDLRCKEVVRVWASNLDKYLSKVVKELPVEEIVFSGYLGELFEYFKEFLTISKKLKCEYIDNYRDMTLIGVSHLIFKDNR